MSSVNDRLFELGIELPAPLKPGFEYVPVTLHGNIAYVSGQLPRLDAQTVISGKVGASADNLIDATGELVSGDDD